MRLPILCLSILLATAALAQDTTAPGSDPELAPAEEAGAAALVVSSAPQLESAQSLSPSDVTAAFARNERVLDRLPKLKEVVTRVTRLEKYDESGDQFALVETFSYANGATSEVVVNVTKAVKIEATRESRKGLVPPLSSEEEALVRAILAEDGTLEAELGNVKLGDHGVVSAAVNPKPFKSVRAAKVRIERGGAIVATRIVDLVRRRVVPASR